MAYTAKERQARHAAYKAKHAATTPKKAIAQKTASRNEAKAGLSSKGAMYAMKQGAGGKARAQEILRHVAGLKKKK